MGIKHTPGPWYVGSGTYEGRNIYSVASVTDDEGFTYQPIVASAEDDGIKCWDANARLIAAAPDLLEALEDAVIDFDNWAAHEDNHPHEHLVAWAEKARAAIAKAKAKGEDQ